MKLVTLENFIAQTTSKSATPGGGSVAALVGACASALTGMVANLTIGKKGYEAFNDNMEEIVVRINQKNQELLQAINDDINAYNLVMQAYRLNKDTSENIQIRNNEIQKALIIAMNAPLNLAKITFSLFDDIRYCAINGNVNALSDAAVAAILARSTILASIVNVKCNLVLIKDVQLNKQVSEEISELLNSCIIQEKEILKLTNFTDL